MKIGDLVRYNEHDMGGSGPVEGQEGLIIGGPKTSTGPFNGKRWQVFWMYCNKIGWWDEFRMGVIDEAR
jgi:hypothetical protein|tara:strand:+ start:860 stop:1066 length:207 start_codon:yes stop_codon:yes gene_type:complete